MVRACGDFHSFDLRLGRCVCYGAEQDISLVLPRPWPTASGRARYARAFDGPESRASVWVCFARHDSGRLAVLRASPRATKVIYVGEDEEGKGRRNRTCWWSPAKAQRVQKRLPSREDRGGPKKAEAALKGTDGDRIGFVGVSTQCPTLCLLTWHSVYLGRIFNLCVELSSW